MKWYGPESREFELDEMLSFATIVANAAEHQLDPEEADAEFNAVLFDLDADDASLLVDLMFYCHEETVTDAGFE